MRRVWKDIVRPGLRDQVVIDLHDHLDFHRHIDQRITDLIDDIHAARYRPTALQQILSEKDFGVCRRMLLPTARDALVLQTIVEHLTPQLLSRQPTKTAFYSRAHSGPTQFEGFAFAGQYSVSNLWTEFRRQLLVFVRTCDYVVTTDIANYFDYIPLRQLRHILSALDMFDESLLDFLFFILDEVSWRPDYLPPSGLGLPQINFDAPRLLAHAFLFEADQLIVDHGSSDAFVRWMDDIDVGVASFDEGRLLLQNLDALLHSRGVRLNSGKTRILDGEQALVHFCARENMRLNFFESSLNLALASGESTASLKRFLRKSFRRFWSAERTANWDKVIGRYVRLFGRARDASFTSVAPEMLHHHPELRRSVLFAYQRLGFSAGRFNDIATFVRLHAIDDASVFLACKVLIDWDVKASYRNDLMNLVAELAARKTPIAYSSAIWMIAKYGTAQEIADFVFDHEALWSKNAYAARQVAAITPRLQGRPEDVAAIESVLRARGLVEALEVLDNLEELSSESHFTKGDEKYLIPDVAQRLMPLPKVLIALTVLTGDLPAARRRALKVRLIARANDRWYQRLLRRVRVPAA